MAVEMNSTLKAWRTLEPDFIFLATVHYLNLENLENHSGGSMWGKINRFDEIQPKWLIWRQAGANLTNIFHLIKVLTRFSTLQALSKKEGKGGMDSPLGDDSDHEGDFTLTPRTEAKYNKIDEEFHLMMQRNQAQNGVAANRVRLGH